MITTDASQFAATQVLGGVGKAGSPAIDASSPSAQTRAEKKLQQAQDAVTTLKGLQNSSKAARTGLAQQKLAALKQRLKALMMMMGGDPKAIARQAAQIAKEIGEAAKEYAAASGGSAAQAAEPMPVSQAAADAEGSDPSATAPESPSEGTTQGDDPTTGEGAATATGQEDSSAAEAPGAIAPKGADSGTGANSPDPFITEARTLAAVAKAVLKAAIARARREHADPAELRDAQARMSGAEKAIDDAARDLAAAASPAAYSAQGQGVAAAAAPAPSVSVQA